MPMKGFREAAKLLKDMATHTASARPAMQAIGRNAVNRHMMYYLKSTSQGNVGGGPPGDEWPGLEASTIKAKIYGWGQYRGKPKSRKLVNTGLLARGYSSKAGQESVEISNREAEKLHYLQVAGVGKKKKKFTIVATDPEKQDPELMAESEEILADFIFTGKATK